MADKEKKAASERPARARKKSIPEADTARLFRTQSGDVAPVGDGARVDVVDAENKRVREIALHPDVFGARVIRVTCICRKPRAKFHDLVCQFVVTQ